MYEGNEPRWRRPPTLSVVYKPDPLIVPLPPARRCANVHCGRQLAQLNRDVLCYRCQDLGQPRRQDLRKYGLRRSKEQTHAS